MRIRRRRPELPEKFWELSNYNGRRAQGVVHTPEYEAEMAVRQEEYDQWVSQRGRGGSDTDE